MIGHWAKECSNPPDDIAKRRQESSSAASSSAKIGSMSGKSGFVHVGSEGSTMMCMCSEAKTPLVWDPISSPRAMSSSLTTTSSCQPLHGPNPCDFLGKDSEVLGSFMQFCGLTTHGAYGLVDTAAQSGLIGVGALGRLGEALREHGLKVRWTSKVGQARGVGGEANMQGRSGDPNGSRRDLWSS